MCLSMITIIMNIDADKQAATPDCDCRGEGEGKLQNTAKLI